MFGCRSAKYSHTVRQELLLMHGHCKLYFELNVQCCINFIEGRMLPCGLRLYAVGLSNISFLEPQQRQESVQKNEQIRAR